MEITRQQFQKLLTVMISPVRSSVLMLSPQEQCSEADRKESLLCGYPYLCKFPFPEAFLSSRASPFAGQAVLLCTQASPVSGKWQLVHICVQLSASMALLFPQCSIFSNWDKNILVPSHMHLLSDPNFQSMHSDPVFMRHYITRTPFA